MKNPYPSPPSFSIRSGSVRETRTLGKALGRRLEDGSVLALTGDLGAGKTAFIQGLARGLDVPRDYYVTSPTYTLVNEYPGRIPLLHVDLYRLQAPVDPASLGLEALYLGSGVVAVEWAERMDPADLGPHLKLTFTIAGENRRNITATACGLGSENLLKTVENAFKELV